MVGMKEAMDELQSKLTDLALEQLPEDHESPSDNAGAASMPLLTIGEMPHMASMLPMQVQISPCLSDQSFWVEFGEAHGLDEC